MIKRKENNGEVSYLVLQSEKFPKVYDSSSEAFSLLIGWICSLFLVTAVKKLPSAGARGTLHPERGVCGTDAPVHLDLLSPVRCQSKLHCPSSIK